MLAKVWNEGESGGNIQDWAPLSERDGEVLVDDGNDDEDYLVGVSPNMRKLVVVKIDKATRQAGSYAVMPLVVDWNDALDATAEKNGLEGEDWWHDRGTKATMGGSVMGAAYAYSGGAYRMVGKGAAVKRTDRYAQEQFLERMLDSDAFDGRSSQDGQDGEQQ